MSENIFKGHGVEVTLVDDEAFLKIMETLTRIGIGNKKTKNLYQSCHILHKQSRYSIVHFKELFSLDGKPATLSEEDVKRRNAITKLLEDWNLLKIINPKDVENKSSLENIKILSYKEKEEWNLVPKYAIGKKKYKENSQ